MRRSSGILQVLVRRRAVSNTDMYSLRDFGGMIGDSARFNAYAKAISRSGRAEDIVAEIGCGPAVFALLACRAGAKRVYAIETEDIIIDDKWSRGTRRRDCFRHSWIASPI